MLKFFFLFFIVFGVANDSYSTGVDTEEMRCPNLTFQGLFDALTQSPGEAEVPTGACCLVNLNY